MYDVLLAVRSASLLQKLKQLHIWGYSTGFQIQNSTDKLDNLIDELRENKYHLVLLEEMSGQMLSLLRTIKKENLSKAVAIVSESAEFKNVRQSFLAGVDDYLITPFEISQFIALFSRIENAEHGKMAAEICRQEELTELFANVDFSIKERLDELFGQIIAEYKDSEETVVYLKRIMQNVVSGIFRQYPWLSNYFDEDDFTFEGYYFSSYEDEIKKYLDDIYAFFKEFSELYPTHSEKMDEILVYILNRPESDLKQKTISEKLYINRSYLSTVFNAQIGTNFVEYVNTVKLKRAAYLLKHTDMKIIDIANLLDYKDMGYFLKRFKAKYGMTPSQYRIPESYEFQI